MKGIRFVAARQNSFNEPLSGGRQESLALFAQGHRQVLLQRVGADRAYTDALLPQVADALQMGLEQRVQRLFR